MNPSELSSGIQLSVQLHRAAERASAFHLNLELNLPSQGVVGILGPSGSGKTTLLRFIAGLEHVEQGQLVVNGDAWQSSSIFLPAYKRPIGYVFQDAGLFPHLSVEGNLRFATKRALKPTSNDAWQSILELMGIEALLQRFPENLSGGEKQRVGIARALLIQPRLLLMDEPLSALDSARKQEILPYLLKLRSSFDLPILYVSHAIEEVAQLADHVLVLEQGQAVAQGTLADVFTRTDIPCLIGQDAGAVWSSRVISRSSEWRLAEIACGTQSLWVRDSGEEIGAMVRVRLLARDVSVALSRRLDSSILNQLEVSVAGIEADKDEAMVMLRLMCDSQILLARITKRSLSELGLSVGQKIWAQVKSVAINRELN